jgi:hypothetical protein
LTATQENTEHEPRQAIRQERPFELRTGAGEKASLALGDAAIEIGSNATLEVHRKSDGSTTIELVRGSVECEVEPKPNRPQFRVHADDVMVTVVGTHFTVNRTDIVEVNVDRGVVSVNTSHEKRTLKAGGSWRGSADASVSLAGLLERREAVATAPLRIEEKSTNPSLPAQRRRPRKPRETTEPVAPRETIAKTSVEYDREELAVSKPSRFQLKGKLARLRGIASQNPRKAAAELLKVATSSSGDRASFALYGRAYLQLFKLEDRNGAVKTAKQYERRFPRGKESEDVLWLRVIALCEGEEVSQCRAAAHTYLRRYASGRFAQLAQRITNW